MRPGGVPGEPDHLVPSGLEGPAAVGVFVGEYAGLLAAEAAGAGGRFQEVGEENRNFGSLMSMTTISGAGEKFAFTRRCAAAGHVCTTGLSEVWLFWRIVILPV